MKTIIITGAFTGIGRATVLRFQAAGWNVTATMRKPDQETELSKLSNVAVLPLDVSWHPRKIWWTGCAVKQHWLQVSGTIRSRLPPPS